MDKLAFVDVGELGWSLYLSGYLRWLKANTPATLCVLTLKDRFCLYEGIADLSIEVEPNPFGSKYPQDRLGFGKIDAQTMREYYNQKLPEGYRIPDYVTFKADSFFEGKMIFKPYKVKTILSDKKDTILIFPRYRRPRSHSWRNLPQKFYVALAKEISKEFPDYNIVSIGSKHGAYSLDIKLPKFKNIVGQTDIQDVIDYCNISVAAIGSHSSLPKLSLLQRVPTFVIGHQKQRVTNRDNWLKTKVGFFEVDKTGYNVLSYNDYFKKIVRILKAYKKRRYINADIGDCMNQIINFIKEATGDKGKQKIKLNIGCGKDIREGYINIDIRSIPGAVKGDVSRLDFENNSVDEIVALDIIEHFKMSDVENVLNEWIRVLKPGGKIRIRTPDVKRICKLYYRKAKHKNMSWQRLSAIIHGGQDYPFNYHYITLSFEWLKEMLEKFGMVRIKKIKSQGQNMIVEAYKKT
jgi:predicted SAM-dependent methyltransferase